jgi:hypothetical protein
MYIFLYLEALNFFNIPRLHLFRPVLPKVKAVAPHDHPTIFENAARPSLPHEIKKNETGKEIFKDQSIVPFELIDSVICTWQTESCIKSTTTDRPLKFLMY